MDARFIDDEGKFLHSCQLSLVPSEGHHVKIHDKTYFLYRITWVLCRPFPYQQAGLEIVCKETV